MFHKVFTFLGPFELRDDIGNLVVDSLAIIIGVLAKGKSTIFIYGSL